MRKQDWAVIILFCLTTFLCIWFDSKPEVIAEPVEEKEHITIVYLPIPQQTEEPDSVDIVIEPEIILTPEEYEYIAKCAFAEAGNQGYLGQVYVIDCILNRFDENKHKSYIDVINSPGQFAVVHNGTIKAKPTEETYQALDDEIMSRTNYEIKYFRTRRYHSFGTPCFQYGDHYFSK